MENRAFSLDALRGYAILTMILSAAVAPGILPGWMYHTQLPPPAHLFDAGLRGLTWVDLVFPFFLFAMGAAFPFSIGKRQVRGESRWRLSGEALLRGMQLAYFAIFTQHMYPYVTGSPQGMKSWGIAILAFLLLFPMFMRLPVRMPEWGHKLVKGGAYGIGTILMLTIDYAGGRNFSVYFSNVILLLLANMAVFGGIIYTWTIGKPLLRLAILLLLLGACLGSTVEGSWLRFITEYSPLPWLYKFQYLGYLFIVIPGSIAGEMLWRRMNNCRQETVDLRRERRTAALSAVGAVGLILINLCGLYARWQLGCLGLTLLIAGCGWWWLRKENGTESSLWYSLYRGGVYLLILGLLWEPFEGGIRKDPPTYSYYFVTSGMAFLALLFFRICCDYYKWRKATGFLVYAGQNPMIAYVSVDLLIMPLLGILGIRGCLAYFAQNPWLGFLQGVILTGLATAVTVFFTKKKWFWRT